MRSLNAALERRAFVTAMNVSLVVFPSSHLPFFPSSNLPLSPLLYFAPFSRVSQFLGFQAVQSELVAVSCEISRCSLSAAGRWERLSARLKRCSRPHDVASHLSSCDFKHRQQQPSVHRRLESSKATALLAEAVSCPQDCAECDCEEPGAPIQVLDQRSEPIAGGRATYLFSKTTSIQHGHCRDSTTAICPSLPEPHHFSNSIAICQAVTHRWI